VGAPDRGGAEERASRGTGAHRRHCAHAPAWERVGREQRAALLESRLLEVHGELQQQEGVSHLIAHRLIDRTGLLGELLTRSRDFH
jgi:hypothetical protein